MYDAFLILAFFLIGLPGGTWLCLQFRAAQKREQTAYDWSVAEIARRTRLLNEKEQAFAADRAAIGKLMQDVTKLRTERNRLESALEAAGYEENADEKLQRRA